MSVKERLKLKFATQMDLAIVLTAAKARGHDTLEPYIHSLLHADALKLIAERAAAQHTGEPVEW